MSEDPSQDPSAEQVRAAELVAEEGGAEEEAERRYEDGADARPADETPERASEPPPVARDAGSHEHAEEPSLAEGPTGPQEPSATGTGVGSAGPQ